MGQRANLAIAGPDDYELYYSHWCANTLTQDLFWGPCHAEAFVRQQRPVDHEDGWLDTIWAEGAAVIDPPRKTLLLYGGEDVLYEVPLRRMYLKLLGAVWPDWTIRWAHEGIVAIAEYLGLPRARVLAETDRDSGRVNLSPPEERDYLQLVASFDFGDDLRLYPLAGLPERYLTAGPALLSVCDDHEFYGELRVADWTSSFPVGGFHVDVPSKTVAFWTAPDAPQLHADVQLCWPGWNVRWHQDRYESQVALTGGALTFAAEPPAELLGRLQQMLDADSTPVDVLGIIEGLAEAEGGKVEINPYALRDDRISLDASERAAILRQAMAIVAADLKT